MSFEDMLSSLDKPNRPKRKILRDFILQEISSVDRPCQTTARAVLIKRHEPQQHQGDPEAVRKAFAAMQDAIDGVTKGAADLTYKVESATFEETLAKLAPNRERTARDELDRLAEEYADKTGRSFADAYDHLAKVEPVLFHKAVCEGH